MNTHPVIELVCEDLKAHPRNYREHPADQLAHISASLKQHGFYRNIVVAEDNTILAGHGVVQAATQLGLRTIPGIRLPIHPLSPQALQVLTGDNEIGKLGVIDDRALTELLKELRADNAENLRGTGLNDEQLAALVMTTRRTDEIRDKGEAAEWVGMPDIGTVQPPAKLIINFLTEEERQQFVEKLDLRIMKKEGNFWTTRYPFREQEDLDSLQFQS